MAAEGGDPSRPLNNSSDTLSGCSRMRRILFRRTRSDTDDKMRNTDRVSKADSVVANAGLESFHPRLAYPVPATVLEEGSTASAPVSALSRLHSVMPISPPPPYDTNQESESFPSVTPASGVACPPTYEQAMAQNGSEDVDNQQGLPAMGAMGSALPAGYCNCLECQTRLYDEEEEAEDNCADAVFPMETHVLMQEVLADGMAFCSLM